MLKSKDHQQAAKEVDHSAPSPDETSVPVPEKSGVYQVNLMRDLFKHQLQGYHKNPINIAEKTTEQDLIYLEPTTSKHGYIHILHQDMLEKIIRPLDIFIKENPEPSSDKTEQIEEFRDAALNYINPLFQDEYRVHLSYQAVLEISNIIQSGNLFTTQGLIHTWKKIKMALGITH